MVQTSKVVESTGREKSNSIQLLDDLAIHSQSRRRNCNLDTSMLPIMETEEPGEFIMDTRPSIFKTIVHDPNMEASQLPNSDVRDSPSLHLYAPNSYNLKASMMHPSMLSAQKSKGNYTASTGLDGVGSER